MKNSQLQDESRAVLKLAPMPRLLQHVRGHPWFASGQVTMARAPGRLDVMGGIADYSGSLVCEMPLMEAAGAAVQVQSAEQLDCESVQMGRRLTVALAAVRGRSAEEVAEALGGEDRWARYLVGCAWWLGRKTGRWNGWKVLVDSDVPLGGGVSSSAAIEVAVMLAMTRAVKVELGPVELAVACQEVENHVVGAPCGVMDQVTSALGGEGTLLRILCQKGADGWPAQVLGDLRMPEGFRFVGVHSGVRHEVSGDPYTDTRVAAFMARTILVRRQPESVPGGHLANVDVKAYDQRLRDLLPGQIGGAEFLAEFGSTGDVVTKVAPERAYNVRAAGDHHVREMDRVTRFVGLLETANREPTRADAAMRAAGQLMYESHYSYGECARLGHAETDRLVKLVAETPGEAGLQGAKITGGGCGGTVAILLRDTERGRAAVERIREAYTAATGRKTMLFDGSSPGAYLLGTQIITAGGGA